MGHPAFASPPKTGQTVLVRIRPPFEGQVVHGEVVFFPPLRSSIDWLFSDDSEDLLGPSLTRTPAFLAESLDTNDAA